MTEEQRAAVAQAVDAFIKIEMAHPASGDHSSGMYRVAEDARQKLMTAFPEVKNFEQGGT